MRKVILLFLTVLLLSSCAVSSALELETQKSGSFETDIEANDFFCGIIEDLASFTRSSDRSLLETATEDFVRSLRFSPYASSASYTKHDDSESYTVNFEFSALRQLVDYLASDTKQTVLTLSDDSLVLDINISNYSQLQKMVPFLADENIEVYGPLYNQDYEVDDYLLMMAFIAGDDAPDGIMSSEISISFKAPSAITHTNGNLTAEDEVSFVFPLIDFLLLKNPIHFYCQWN